MTNQPLDKKREVNREYGYARFIYSDEDVKQAMQKLQIKIKVEIDSMWGNLNSINGHKELKNMVDKVFQEEIGEGLL